MAQMTSLSLHWFPACVAWTQRWYPHRSERLGFDSKSLEAKREWESGSLASLVLIPMIPYLCWAAAYFIKVRCAFPPACRLWPGILGMVKHLRFPVMPSTTTADGIFWPWQCRSF